MATEYDDLQDELALGMIGNNKSPIGTAAGDLTGLSPTDPRVGISPCAQLKWLNDNTNFKWVAYVELEHDGGRQGIRAIRPNGSIAKDFSFEMKGGDDSSPYKQIPINHRKMMGKALFFVGRKKNLI